MKLKRTELIKTNSAAKIKPITPPITPHTAIFMPNESWITKPTIAPTIGKTKKIILTAIPNIWMNFFMSNAP